MRLPCLFYRRRAGASRGNAPRNSESTEREGPKLVRFLADSGALPVEMECLMTAAAEGDEVLFGVVPESASWMDVVNLELGCPTAVLAAPVVPLQHLLA